jgi:hypothetical protein
MKRFTAFISAILILTFVLGLPGSAVAASNRTAVVGGIWAKDAPAPGNNPITGTTYANDALSESVINNGWPFSQVVNSATFNEFMRRISIILTLSEQWGVLPWSTSTAYTTGAVVTGSDNYQYKALQGSSGKDPVSYPTYWALENASVPNYALSTGSNNAYAITIPQKNALTPGQPVFFKANFSNTGSCTLSVNSQTPVIIKNARGVVLSSGDIPQNAIVMVTYDSVAANYVLISGNVAYLSELAAFALKNGSSSNKFSVANGTTGNDAVNYAQMIAAIAGVTGVDLSAYAKTADVSTTLQSYARLTDLTPYAPISILSAYALKNGDVANKFSVANGVAGTDAVNVQQFPAVLSGNGCQKLPSGLIIQWGKTITPTGNIGSGRFTEGVSFPCQQAFTTVFSVSVLVVANETDYQPSASYGVTGVTKDGFTIAYGEWLSGTSQQLDGFYWVAYGK